MMMLINDDDVEDDDADDDDDDDDDDVDDVCASLTPHLCIHTVCKHVGSQPHLDS